jgi:homogentisate 1,2-dioxygenase
VKTNTSVPSVSRKENPREEQKKGEKTTANLQYQSGFGNTFSTEALPGALPEGQNSPQQCPYGLFAEQLSGSSFTMPRHENQRSWLYRIYPAVLHSGFKQIDEKLFKGKPVDSEPVSPQQLRWDPQPFPETPTDFIEGMITVAANGSGGSFRGCAVHTYAINNSMGSRFFYDADAELLIVPQSGTMQLRTELGDLHVAPGEIAVVPRGVRFQANPLSEQARGYVAENFGANFRLPSLGPIGSNGLANPRDFLTPVARYEDKAGDFKLIAKFQNHLWESSMKYSPLSVVAWHGNYAPYKYDLAKFQAVNSVSFDHVDPSVFTVLSSASEIPGMANIDFVIFPPRWAVSEHTFRPPFFHRNCMSEYMGLITGQYDAKESGFVPGGGSLHNCMSAHGPDNATFEKASTVDLKPSYMADTLAFMFESSLVFTPTAHALESPQLQSDYLDCWQGLTPGFNAEKK